jgi:hypothetical protein
MKQSSIGDWLLEILPIGASSVAWQELEAINKPISNDSGPERKRGNGNSVAQVKREAIKAKNRARNRAAHR